MDEMDMMMALPEEMRIKIFNLIPQEDTINTRLVCKAWNQEIQDNYEYCIKLNEDSPYFNSKLKLRVKELRVQQLETTPVMNPDGTSIFSHPNTIVRFTVGRNWGAVAQLNLHMMLGLFQENLVQLHLDVNAVMCNYKFPPGLSFNLKHLKILIITSLDFVNDDVCNDNPRSLFQVLENSSFAKLTVLKIYFGFLKIQGATLPRIIANVLRILSKHGKFLEELIIDIQELRELNAIPDTIQQQELLRIKQIKTLKKLILYLPSVNSKMNRFWNEFISIQNKLTQLDLECRFPIYPFSLVRQVVLNNATTLEYLQIIGLCTPPTDSTFDLSIFQNCSGLNTLRLDLQQNSIILTNFHKLPANIVTLCLRGLKILSEEILTAFHLNNPINETKGFRQLEELRLVGCGDQGLFGINTDCLHEIMMIPRPNLMNVDFRFGGIHERDESMVAVLQQLQLYGHREFGVRRDSADSVWRYYN